MLSHVLALLVGTLLLAPGASPFSVLTAYNGNWNVVAVHPFGGGAAGVADKLENRCTETADSYRCEQTVNGSHVATVIFTVAAGTPGTFTVTSVLADGTKFSNTTLHVDGGHWTYATTVAATSTTYRTENVFSGRDHIHFVQSQSTDGGKTWTETNSGDEMRVANAIP